MSLPGVTVVVPTINRPNLLDRCLQHLLAGTLVPWRIVVVDQSVDTRTRDVVERFRNAGAPVTVIHLADAGASAARNAGLDAADTQLVAFIDDDCVAEPAWLASLVAGYVNASAHGPVAAVTGRVVPLLSTSGGLAVSSRTSTTSRTYDAADGSLDRAEWAPWDVGTGANILAPVFTMRAISGFDRNLGPGTRAAAGEDVDLLYRLARRGSLVYEPAATVAHPTVSRRRRLRSRTAYGRGMGAMLAAGLQAGDPAARALTSSYVRHQVAQSTRGGAWAPIESLLLLWGAAGPLAGAWVGAVQARLREAAR